MKTFITIILLLTNLFFSSGFKIKQNCTNEVNKPRLAIIIDDFGGYNRTAITEMLELDIPLTCAVMPLLPYTEKDANAIFNCKKEVILHMPMEADKKIPENWYGKIKVCNFDNQIEAVQKVEKCLNSVPHACGMNLHIGSGVCLNQTLIKAIMESIKSKNMYFVDSFTNPKSVCSKVAIETKVKFCKRTEFLEKTGEHSYDYAKKMLINSANFAKKYGYAVAIGHVGAEGGITTVNAIRDSINLINSMGVELCCVSKFF